MKTHELKIWPDYFKAVSMGIKTFEVRKSDRDFVFGDTVVLKEWDPTKDFIDHTRQQLSLPRGYTGREVKFRIGYIFQLDGDECVFSLLPILDGLPK